MKKIGIFDSGVDTPEEIIIAAGFIPYRFFGDPTIEPNKANEHIPPTHCVWTRNLLELAITYLDKDIVGIIATHGCDRTNREFDIWRECLKLDFMYFLNSPRKRDNTALKFFINDINEFIIQLEDHFKIKITENDLKEAIKKTNKIRKLLREISEYRNKMIITGSEFHGLVKDVQKLNKDDALEILKAKLENLKERQPFSKKDYKRILLTGSDLDDTEFIRYIESLGFQVVIDDLGIGTKYFTNDIEENGNPIESIAKYHLNKPIHATKFPSYQRFEVLKKLATEYNVDGVINIAQKFCEPVLYDHPYLRQKFKELEIPYMFTEVTYNREAYKQLSTRFSAFAEMI
ncbi:MAG: 2-hydroxyacyl-CoA dehydratase [Candidatus Lokiarchaeota archaeon]|nr:2-hydroxyacyl-CoA dehydratase [Candidatus Lokiarchaeota archaeon]